MRAKRPRWRPRRVALAAALSFALAVLAEFIDYSIYADYSDTQLCTAFRQECGRAYAYWAVFIAGDVFLVASLAFLIVAITRSISSRRNTE